MSMSREDTRVRRRNSCWSCELLCGMSKGHMIRCFCSCWSSAWHWAAPDSGDLRATKTPVIWIKTGSSWAAGVWASRCLIMVRLITVSISALQSNVNDDEAYLDYQRWGRSTEMKCPIWPSVVPWKFRRYSRSYSVLLTWTIWIPDTKKSSLFSELNLLFQQRRNFIIELNVSLAWKGF